MTESKKPKPEPAPSEPAPLRMSLWRQRQIERRIGDLGEFARADERERKGKPKP